MTGNMLTKAKNKLLILAILVLMSNSFEKIVMLIILSRSKGTKMVTIPEFGILYTGIVKCAFSYPYNFTFLFFFFFYFSRRMAGTD